MKLIAKFKKYKFFEIKRKIDNHYGLGAIEGLLFTNWFNPFATFWLNFRSFPIPQAIRFPIFVYGRPRFYNLSGEIKIEGQITLGMIKFNQVRLGSPNVQSLQSEILNQGTIIFHGKGVIGTGNIIRVAATGILEIGSDFKVADMCNIGCYECVKIGDLCRITHRCQVLDSNYHYVANFNKRIIPMWHKPISIGNGCWICNSSTITGGATIPDYTIVASNSLVNKDFSEIEKNSMIGGTPAKFLASGFRRVENKQMERIVNKFYNNNPDNIYRLPEDTEISECSKIY